MLKFSEEARNRIIHFMKDKNLNAVGLRLPSGDGAFFDLEAIDLSKVTAQEAFLEAETIMFIFDKDAREKIQDAMVDYIPGGLLPGRFVIEHVEPLPQGFAGPDMSDPKVRKIQEVLEKDINPAIASHGGTARLLDYRNNLVYLQLGGGCQGCGGVSATLKQGIEVRLKEALPEIRGIVDQTEHEKGTNPYL